MGIWNLKSIHRLIAIAAALITFSSNANSQDLMGFDRASYGSVVLSQIQSAGSDLQLELSIGNYENEPIINYSPGSVFAQIGRSVGRLDVLTDKGVFPCTAFIVSEKHILTNYHCSKGLLDNEKIGASRIDAIQFVAGYTQTGIDEGTKKYTVIPTPVEASKTLDYAVLEVIGDPSQEFGKLKLASVSPTGGDPFWIIGHPMGEGQRISREKCKANNPALSAGKLLHTCDTLPGNSGSPVIDAGLQQVVALHHAGSKADSVNFAIPMLDILANTKVLTAYSAPEVMQQISPKTLELTACDALYIEAKEAKACFAYEAYFKSCRDHSLAPIADGYINEFCQVQEVAEVEEAGSGPSCTSLNPNVCSADDLCSKATKTVDGKKKWLNGFGIFEAWAKERGLNCGVSSVQTSSIEEVCSPESPNGCTNDKLCSLATYGSLKFFWQESYTRAVEEAKKRGLNCGVEPQTVKFQQLPLCPAGGFLNNCFGSRTILQGKWKGDEWIGYYKDNHIVGIATALSLSNNQWKGDVRIGERKNNRWSGNLLYIWQTGETRFEEDWDQNKTYYSNSTVNTVFPLLKKLFQSLPKNKRISIHKSLAKKQLYSAQIDGVWGRNTLIGISRFAAEYLNLVDLRSKYASMLILDEILQQSALERTKAAPPELVSSFKKHLIDETSRK